jgi:hypothetical protein
MATEAIHGRVAIGEEGGHVIMYFDDGSFIVMTVEQASEVSIALEYTVCRIKGEVQ